MIPSCRDRIETGVCPILPQARRSLLQQFGDYCPVSTLHQVAGCDNPGRQVDVVFIHGLGGDAFGTWRCSGAEDAFWPAWLAEEVPEAGVWTLSYPAGPTRHLRWIRRIPWIGRWIAGPGARPTPGTPPPCPTGRYRCWISCA